MNLISIDIWGWTVLVGLFCVHILPGIATKNNWDNYTVGVNTVSHLEALPAVSSTYDSRSWLPWGCTEAVDKGVGVERVRNLGWGCENLMLSR